MKLTQKTLKELLYYDPDTGIFTWLKRDVKWFMHCENTEGQCNAWNANFANKNAVALQKTISATDYIRIIITINGNSKKYMAHRLAWLYYYGEFPNKLVLHSNGNGLDNRIKSLSLGDKIENGKDQKIKINNKSGFNGVDRVKNGKWRVRIKVDNKEIHGGYFFSLEDAIEKRIQMNIKYCFHPDHGKRS